MAYQSFEQVVQVSGVSTATLNRRLAYIKKYDPAFYKRLYTKDSRTKLYDTDLLLPVLKDWTGYIAKLENQGKEAAGPAPLPKKARTKDAPPHKPHTPHGPPPADPQRQQKLTKLLEAPVVLTPTSETLALFNKITDPHVRERVEYAIAICDRYSRGDVTLETACQDAGIPPRTFNDWKNQHAEIATLYKRARRQHRKARAQLIGELAQDALTKLIVGEEWDEVTTMYKNRPEPDGTITRIPVGSKQTRKRTGRSPQAVIFALTNALPGLYQNRILPATGPTPEQAARDEIDKMTPEQRMEALQKLLAEKMDEASKTLPTST